MAEFVTRAENQRRLIVIVVCVIFDTAALAGGIYALKRSSDLEKGEKGVTVEGKHFDSILQTQARVEKLEKSNWAAEQNLIDFARPIGWRSHATWTTDRKVTGYLSAARLKSFLNEWAGELRWRPAKEGETESLTYGLRRRVQEAKEAAERRKKSDWISAADKANLEKFTEELNEVLTEIDKTEEPPLWQGEIIGVTLKKLFDDLEKLENAYNKLADKLESRARQARDAETEATSEADKQLGEATTQLLKTIDDLLGGGRQTKSVADLKTPEGLLLDLRKAEGLVKGLPETEKSGPERIAAKEADLAAALQKVNEQAKRNAQFEAENKLRIKDLENRLNWFKHRREEAKERREPDGEILAVVDSRQIAYIDLLHKDRLFRGTKFSVYSLEKGGIKIDKGEVEVIEVRDSGSSVVAITKTDNASDPIKTGDRIYNEVYEKGKPRYVAVAGRLRGRLSNEEAASLLRKQGDFYQEKVDERTNYLVVGEGYAGRDGVAGLKAEDPGAADDDPNFRLAREWGVKILLERTLYDYLGVK